jgi:acyl-CoA synthetase (AMP-forming)/AMP-acid ligase II/3-oxoacyl-(acyl-carrier-protein) synthase/acyl carrier protein
MMSRKAIQHGNQITLPNEYSTLAEMFVHIAQKFPHKGITYVDGAGKEDFISYPKLIENARRYLTALYQKGLKLGDVVILVIDNPKEFYLAFWACIFGGIVAAPVSQPTSWEPNSTGLLKLTKIWDVLEKPVVLIEEQHRKSYRYLQESPQYQEFRFISTQELISDELEEIHWTKPDDLVLLQFSSGSTGTPKGVKLTNKNIIYNNIASSESLEMNENDVVFTWLPHTHDMGLFGQHLTPIINGSNIMVFSPYTFIRSPYLFLKKITEHKGTWFCSTNFGFDWMVQKVPDEKLSTLDLSSLRFTLNGAEPISTSVMEKFIEKFSSCGYKENMMLPAYGMAEATVAVTLSKVGSSPRVERISRSKMVNATVAIPVVEHNVRDNIEFVHEGYPIGETSIRIADEQGNTLDEYMIGEIQIKGASVTSGYYNRDDLAETMFVDGWLRTGDLGFMVDQSLVVSGRIKDILFIRGQNYFAHDLEEMIYDLGTIPRGNIVIVGQFNSRSQQEELLVFVRHKGDVEKFLPLRQSIIDRIQESLGIEVTHVIPIKSIPKTTSGKLQRFHLRNSYENGDYNQILDEIELSIKKNYGYDRVIHFPRSELEKYLHQSWSDILNIQGDRISIDDEFFRLGGNSIKAYQLLDKIEEYLGREIGTEVLVLCKTIRQIAEYLESMPSVRTRSFSDSNTDHKLDVNKAVAITGLALRLPNAKTKEEFWDNLCSKRDSISKISSMRKELSCQPEWDDWIGELEDIDQFDNEFFEIPAEEAMFMDPQQRLILETSYEALEDAGIVPNTEEKRNVGVYGGICSNSYYQLLLNQLEKGEIKDVHPNAMVGNMNNMICALISNFYNFTGPSLAIDTACSSFLVALHHAVAAIRQNSINGAVVAGANIMVTPTIHSLSRNAGIVSSTKFTKVFDSDADGSVPGEGVVVVYLEPLTKAVKENKNIYGVIRGTAVNNDGYSLSLMAPNPKGQYNVLSGAYKDANLSPNEISYIEAHGSGTAIGDPIEMNALNKLFTEKNKNTEGHIGIGSVKSNIGHLLPAAGGAGLAKVLLCLKNQKMVPSLHVKKINPALELEKSPFYIVEDVGTWSIKDQKTRKAGISSFGLGGTNVHVVLEEWTGGVYVPNKQKSHLLTLSANSEKALESMITQTQEMMKNIHDLDLNNLCFTRNRYRKHYSYRAACVISTAEKTESLHSVIKGHFLKNRSAKLCLMIGDLKNDSGKKRSVLEEESNALFRKSFIELSDVTHKHNIIDVTNVNRNELLYFSYWYTLLKNLVRFGTNTLDISGIKSGKIFSDLLNEKIDVVDALKQYFETNSSNRGEQIDKIKQSEMKADIVLSLGMPQKKIVEVLSNDVLPKTKIVSLEPEADVSFDEKLLSIMGELYIAGADFDWELVHPNGTGKLISLPAYPFERRSYWINQFERSVSVIE